MSGYHDSSVSPQPNPKKTMRLGGVGFGAAEANLRKPSDSKKGRAMIAVEERRKCRRFRVLGGCMFGGCM